MRSIGLVVSLAALLGGCVGDISDVIDDPGPTGPGDPGAVNDPGTPVIDPTDPKRCAAGASWIGFDGVPLESWRVEAIVGTDRARIKPYSALSGEYARVLGKAPASLGALGSTFGADPPRWWSEPQSSAVTLYASLRVAFQGCLALTAAAPKYDAAPTAASAASECSAWATSFWSREPAPAEIDACVKVAVTDTVAERNPERRWAYACAGVLSAAGFLTY